MLSQIFRLVGFFMLVLASCLLLYTSFFLFIYLKQMDDTPYNFYAIRAHELEYYIVHIVLSIVAGALLLRQQSWGWMLLLFLLLFMMGYCFTGGHSRFLGKSLMSPIFWTAMGFPFLILLELPKVRRHFQLRWYHDAIAVALFALDMYSYASLPDYWR